MKSRSLLSALLDTWNEGETTELHPSAETFVGLLTFAERITPKLLIGSGGSIELNSAAKTAARLRAERCLQQLTPNTVY
jgi:hypothetical protein